MRKVINYFVPKKYADDQELSRKSRFIVWFIFIAGAVSVFFSGVLLLTDGLEWENGTIGLSIVCLLIVAIFQFRKRGAFIFTTHFICGIFILAAGGMPYNSGGIFSPDLPTLYVLPLFALIMGNFRIGIFYAILTLLILFTYYFLNFNFSSLFLEQVKVLPPAYFMSNLVLNLVVILFLVFRNEKMRLQLLGELKQTNLIISHKSQEITDSINYAKRIQTAILPEVATVKSCFPESFILYLPKDIVSGDFYWVTEKDGFRFIAVADCTGHGVPGALMSVIGVNQLDDVVQEKGILEPSQILENLDRNVNKILKQSQAEINDGMDIAILKVNLKDRTLVYAGANRPLYYVRNKQLTEIKATKLPIGGMDLRGDKKFVSTQLQLRPSDTVYLSTDGFADQFGGEGNKKITTKKFKRMLESVSHLNLSEQEKRIHDLFSAHRGSNEQVDDVLVAGFRVE